MRGVVLALVTLVAATAVTAACAAGTATPRLAVVVRGLQSPVDVVQAPGEPNRLYVVEQPGRIRIVQGGRIRGTFLDVRAANAAVTAVAATSVTRASKTPRTVVSG